MKYENLMDIPDGYEMQLAEDYSDEYPKGTKVIRGNTEAHLDDEESVSFTFPDGHWEYLYRKQIEHIPKEYKGMKGSDKVMVELTGYQVAKIYALMGQSNGPDNRSTYDLAQTLLGDFDQEVYDEFFFGNGGEKTGSYNTYYRDWEAVILEPETPTLTEAQKKALELKETIAKAQKQLEELEKEI